MSDDAPLTVSLHGEHATIEDAIEVGKQTKKLLEEVGRAMGVEGVEWLVGSVEFKCDGCDLRRSDRPDPSEGWTYDDGNDYCPECIIRRAAS